MVGLGYTLGLAALFFWVILLVQWPVPTLIITAFLGLVAAILTTSGKGDGREGQ